MPTRSFSPPAPTLLAAGALALSLGGTLTLWRGERAPDRARAAGRSSGRHGAGTLVLHPPRRLPHRAGPGRRALRLPAALRGGALGHVGWLEDATPAADEDADARAGPSRQPAPEGGEANPGSAPAREAGPLPPGRPAGAAPRLVLAGGQAGRPRFADTSSSDASWPAVRARRDRPGKPRRAFASRQWLVDGARRQRAPAGRRERRRGATPLSPYPRRSSCCRPSRPPPGRRHSVPGNFSPSGSDDYPGSAQTLPQGSSPGIQEKAGNRAAVRGAGWQSLPQATQTAQPRPTPWSGTARRASGTGTAPTSAAPAGRRRPGPPAGGEPASPGTTAGRPGGDRPAPAVLRVLHRHRLGSFAARRGSRPCKATKRAWVVRQPSDGVGLGRTGAIVNRSPTSR